MKALFLFLVHSASLIAGYTPNDYDSSGQQCRLSRPAHISQCPSFCVEATGPEDINKACGSPCNANASEILWPDGSCNKADVVCGSAGGAVRSNTTGLYECESGSPAFNNPCACVSSETRSFQACPPRNTSLAHYDTLDDVDPPNMGTMQNCARDAGVTTLSVLRGADDDGDSGFVQCPLTLIEVDTLGSIDYTLTVVDIILLATLLIWTTYRVLYLKKHPVRAYIDPRTDLLEPPAETLSMGMLTPVSLVDEVTDHFDDLDLDSVDGQMPPGAKNKLGKKTSFQRQDTAASISRAARHKPPIRVGTLQNISDAIIRNPNLKSQTGYKQHLLGTLAFTAILIAAAMRPVLFFLQILDAYGLFGNSFCPDKVERCLAAGTVPQYQFRLGWPCGAHCVWPDAWSTGISPYWPYLKGGRMGGKYYLVYFLSTWLFTVWLMLLLIVTQGKIRSWCRIRCPLINATLVEVQVSKPAPIAVEISNGGTIEKIVAMHKYHLISWFVSRTYTKVCNIVIDESGARSFTFRSQKYIWSNSLDRFVIADVEVGHTCREILGKYDSDLGLSHHEAFARLRILGPNSVEVRIPSIARSIFNEFFSLNFIYQVSCLVVWYVFYYWFAASIVLSVIIGSCILRVIARRQGQQKMKSMAESTSEVQVVRDGEIVSVPSSELTVGDIVVLEAQSQVQADLVLLAGSCVMNESCLTGESAPIPKVPLKPSDQPYDKKLVDAKSTLLSGTWVQSVSPVGGTRAVVMAIAGHTNRGKMMVDTMCPTELQFKFDVHWNVVFSILLLWGLINVVIGVALLDWQLEGWYYGIFTVSQVMSPLIPAVFVAGQTVATRRLAHKGINCVNLQRTMVAAKVKTVCFDKTGTLTESLISLWSVIPSGDNCRPAFTPPELRDTDQRLYDAILCGGLGRITGEDVDVGMSKWTQPILSEIGPNRWTLKDPFDPSREFEILRQYDFQRATMSSSIVVQSATNRDRLTIVTKGSWETVRNMSLPSTVSTRLDALHQHLSSEGYYVIAVASRSIDASEFSPDENRVDHCESQLSFLGFVAFHNSLIPSALPTIQALKEGDCRCMMITGDNHLTAFKVATDCGILDPELETWAVVPGNSEQTATGAAVSDEPEDPGNAGEPLSVPVCVQLPNGVHMGRLRDRMAHINSTRVQLVVTGPALTAALAVPEVFPRIQVVARATPQQKVQVVSVSMATTVTAMVGDGANDAAALERAHCGVAVGSDANPDSASVAHFSAQSHDLTCVVDVLRVGRGSLAATTAAYKNLIIYGEITMMVSLLEMWLHVVPGEAYWILVDAVVNSGMTWAILRSRPAKKLAPARPTSSLLGWETCLSSILIMVVDWIIMLVSIALLFQQSWFQCRQFDSRTVEHSDWWTKGDNYEAATLGIVGLFQWISAAPVYSFGGKFRRPFWTNYEVWILFLIFFVLAVVVLFTTGTWLTCLFRTNCGDSTVLNWWFEHKIWDGIVSHSVGNGTWMLPEGCPCSSQIGGSTNNTMCEWETLNCAKPEFQQTFHHNLFPMSFRIILLILGCVNVIVNFAIQRIGIQGPLKRVVVRWWKGRQPAERPTTVAT